MQTPGGLRLNIGTINRFQFGYESSPGTNGILQNAPGDVNNYNDNIWHHVVGTFSSATGLVPGSAFKIYIDGNLAQTIPYHENWPTWDTTVYAPVNNGTRNTIIGNCGGTYANFTNAFLGILDDIGIWNRALTPCEITQLYNSQTYTPPTLSANNTINYCSDCELVCPNLSLTSVLGCGNLDTVKVYFTSGYVQGQDTLQFIPQLGINSSFNSSTGVLTLYGNANYADWETALKAVCYKSLVANNSNTIKNLFITTLNPFLKQDFGNYSGMLPYDVSDADPIYKSLPDLNGIISSTFWPIPDAVGDGDIGSSFLVHHTQCPASFPVGGVVWKNNPLINLVANQAYEFSYYSYISSNLADPILSQEIVPSSGILTVLSATANSLVPQSWIKNSVIFKVSTNTTVTLRIKNGQSDCFGNDFGIDNIQLKSVGNVTVHILPQQDTTINITICQGQSYVGHTTTGTWTDTLTSVTGCDSIRTLNLTVNSLPSITITASPNDTICAGLPVSMSAMGANTYSWSGGINNGTPFTPSATTSYTVTGTSAAGCTSTAIQTVNVMPLPTISMTTLPTPAAICNGDNISLTATGANSYSWSGGITNGVAFTPSGTATYAVTGTGNFGCTITATILVTINPTQTFTINHSICQGQTYLGYSTTGIHIDTFTNTNGCDSIRTLNLTVNSLPALNITPSPNDSICTGFSVALTATGANTYLWSSGVSNGTPFTPNATTSYTVTGTSTAGCTSTAIQTVTVMPLPAINITTIPTPAAVCNGDNISLTATGANSYSWSGGISNGITFLPSATTTYTVTGTNSFGCIKTATKLVTVFSTQSFTINHSICQGQTYLGYSTNGIHIDTFTNANGCDSIRTLNLTVNPFPTLTITPSPNDSICNGDNVSLTGTGANSYSWTSGVINGTQFTPSATNTYTVTGTSTAGCTNTAIQTVTVMPLPAINITTVPTPSAVCISDNISLTATGANSYSWSGGIINGVAFTPSATTTYTVTGTGNFGCTKTATKLVTVNPIQTFTINHSICQGQTYLGYSTTGVHIDTFTNANGCDSIRTLNLLVNSITYSTISNTICQPNSYLGYNTTGNFVDTLVNVNGCDSIRTLNLIVNSITYSTVNHSICQGQSYSGYNSTGAYLDTFVNATGCDSIRTLNLTVNPLPAISIIPNTAQICNGDSISLTALGANTYSWSPSTGLNTTTSNSVIANPATSTLYTVVGTDANSCSNSISNMLTVYNTYTKLDTITICEGSSYTFGTQSITTAGTYFNTFNTIHGCDSIIQLLVNVIEKPVANFIVPPNICANTPIEIDNTWISNTSTYAWTLSGNPTINSQDEAFINVTWNSPGTRTISVLITPALPCWPVSFTATTNVIMPYAKIAIENNDTVFCVYDRVNLKTYSNPTYKYEWNPPPYFISNTSMVSGELREPIYATVKVTDTFGCIEIDTMFLNVQPCCYAFLPNAFTPNGDTENDVFRIIGEGNYHILDFYIANRWGNIVFKTIDEKQGWDGKYLGKEQDMGVYFYYLKYECSNLEKRVIKGEVTLLR